MKNFLKILVEMQTKLKGQTEGNLSTDSHKIYLNVAIGKAKEIIEGYLSNLKAEAFPKYQKAIKEFVTDHPLPPSVFALSGYKLFIKGKPQTVTHMFADIGRAVGLAKEEKKKDDHTEEQKFYALKPDLGRKLDAISKDYPNIKNPETSIDVIPCDTDEHKRCRVAKALWDFICKVETKLKNNEIPPSELDLQQALAVALNPQADLQKAARPERKGLSS